MMEYAYSIPPRYVDLPSVSQTEAEMLAHSFLRFSGVDHAELELSLLIHFVAVFHFKGKDKETGTSVSGWLVGGRLPHLPLSDLEIQTPIEALAIYALYERTWIDAKGVPDTDGSVPIYRIPYDWEPLSFPHGFKAWRMGALTSFIAWTLIPMNTNALLHPEIREKCCRRGWIQKDPAS